MTFRLHECYDFRAVLSLSTEAERLGGPPGAAVTNQLSAACFLFHSPLSYFIAFETFFFLQRWTLPLVAMQQKNTSKLFSFLFHSFFHRSRSEGHSCVEPLCATSPLQPFSAFLSNPTHAKLFLWQPFHLTGASAWAEVGSDPEPSSFLPLCDGTCLLGLLRTFWNTSYYHNLFIYFFQYMEDQQETWHLKSNII